MGFGPIYEQEKGKYKITILVRKDGQFWVSNNVSPAYCLSCEQQIEGEFAYLAGRYGQVGEVQCPVCKSIMCLTDNDHDMNELYMSLGQYRNPFLFDLDKFDAVVPVLHIQFDKLYRLSRAVFQEIERLTGFDLFAMEADSDIDLHTLVDKICEKAGIDPSELPTAQITFDERLPRMPEEVNRWLNLLRKIGVPDVLPDVKPMRKAQHRRVVDATVRKAETPVGKQGKVEKSPTVVAEPGANAQPLAQKQAKSRPRWKTWLYLAFAAMLAVGFMSHLLSPERAVETAIREVAAGEYDGSYLSPEEIDGISSFYQLAEEQGKPEPTADVEYFDKKRDGTVIVDALLKIEEEDELLDAEFVTRSRGIRFTLQKTDWGQWEIIKAKRMSDEDFVW